MIKNKLSLSKNSSFPTQAKKALQIIEAGLKAVETGNAVKKAKLPKLKRFEKVYVVGFGKAAAATAEALEKRLGKRISDGAVVSTRKARTKRIRSFVGTHPLPSKKNVEATKKILEIAEKAGSKDLVVCLASGGGSALLALPAEQVCVRELARTSKLLIQSKATIREINCVRKHLSRIKGGQLMQAAYPAKMHTLVVSDVVGNDPAIIASGPTVGDKSTFKQAISVIKKYRLWKKAPAKVRLHLSQGARRILQETPKPGNKIFRKARNEIVLNNTAALKAMQRKAKALGLNAVIYSSRLQGEARKTGRKLAAIAGKKRKPTAIIAGGETTVEVKGKGLGGRNQELVLGSLEKLAGMEKAVLVSIGSDGIDGNSRAAGAIADSKTIRKRGDWKDFLERNDSNAFFKRVRGEIVTGNTETNVMDLQLLLAWN